MYAGFGDGLIMQWEISKIIEDKKSQPIRPLIGHINKINHMLFENNTLFSASQDCTLRLWNVDSEVCIRIFKFQDPIMYTCYHAEYNFLFTGCWDKQVRAIDLKTGEIDRAFVASKDAVKCLHLYDKWLFVGGMDPVIRAFDLTSGNVVTYEGHSSWVMQMKVWASVNDQGDIKHQWLFSSSDDGTIRVWDIKTQLCLDELIGHKSGVTCMSFTQN